MKSLAVVTTISVLLVCVGGTTLQLDPSRRSRTQEFRKGNASAALSSQQPQTLESVARTVFEMHGFPPPVFIEGTNSTKWAVSARPRSSAEFDLALLKITSGREIVVRLEPYAKVGTNWPILGHLFRAPSEQEAREMGEQMRVQIER